MVSGGDSLVFRDMLGLDAVDVGRNRWGITSRSKQNCKKKKKMIEVWHR